MIDVHTIYKHVSEGNELTIKLRQVANVAMTGTIFLNGFAGRSKEWRIMQLSHVKKVIASGKTYFTCSQHKTAKTYGDLGKHIADGTMETIKRYIELPGTGRDIFLEPGKLTMATVSVSSLLYRFGSVYLSGHQYPTVNLMRKYYHTEIMRDSSKAIAFVARLDAHSEGVARQVYVASNPEQDAQKAKELVSVIMNGPVEWPTQEELDAGCIDELQNRFARSSACDGDADDVADSDDMDHDAMLAAVPDQPAAKKKRRYEYLQAEKRFVKNDPEPNMIVHTPPPEYKQTVLTFNGASSSQSTENTLPSGSQSVARGKKSHLTE